MSKSEKTSKAKPAARETIADLLRRKILERETVAEVVRGTGIAQPVLHRFIHGERDLTLRTAAKLFEFFGLEIRETRPRGKAK
jgi:plasmid maintenance system antidote protein VapI